MVVKPSFLPNFLSFIRIALTPLFIYLFWQEGSLFIWSIVVFSIAALTDLFDGYLARRSGHVSDLGTFLDPFADKVLVWSAFVCCAMKGLVFWPVVGLIVVRDTLVTVLRMLALKQGRSLRTLYAAKCKTVAQIIMLYVAFLCLLIRSYGWQSVLCDVLLSCVMLSVVVLTVYTGIEYVLQYFRIKK